MIVGIPMVIEHIIPLVGGGSSTADNLCLAYYRCNEFKGSRTEAADPIDGKLTMFFTHDSNVGLSISPGMCMATR